MDQIESEIEQVYAGSRKKKLDRDVRLFCENINPKNLCKGSVLASVAVKMPLGTLCSLIFKSVGFFSWGGGGGLVVTSQFNGCGSEISSACKFGKRNKFRMS